MIELQPGDIFCSSNPMWLGRAINFVQKIWAKDNASEYSHSGIIIDSDGTTFESLWRVRRQNLFKAYKGDNVLIGRYQDMNPDIFKKMMDTVEHHENDIYPIYRLFFHLLPPVAKYVHMGQVVCSELTNKSLYGGKIVNYYYGSTPDDVADMIITDKKWDIINKGVI